MTIYDLKPTFQHPDVPVMPIFLHGLGKALPKNDWLLVPFFIDVFVGDALYFREMTGSNSRAKRQTFMDNLNTTMHALADEGHFPAWE